MKICYQPSTALASTRRTCPSAHVETVVSLRFRLTTPGFLADPPFDRERREPDVGAGIRSRGSIRRIQTLQSQ